MRSKADIDYANRSAPACVTIKQHSDECVLSQPCAIAALTAAPYSLYATGTDELHAWRVKWRCRCIGCGGNVAAPSRYGHRRLDSVSRVRVRRCRSSNDPRSCACLFPHGWGASFCSANYVSTRAHRSNLFLGARFSVFCTSTRRDWIRQCAQTARCHASGVEHVLEPIPADAHADFVPTSIPLERICSARNA